MIWFWLVVATCSVGLGRYGGEELELETGTGCVALNAGGDCNHHTHILTYMTEMTHTYYVKRLPVKSFLNLPDYWTSLSHPKQISIKIHGWNKKTNQSDFTGFYHKTLTSFTGQFIFNKSKNSSKYLRDLNGFIQLQCINSFPLIPAETGFRGEPLNRPKTSSALALWTSRNHPPPGCPMCFLNPSIL